MAFPASQSWKADVGKIVTWCHNVITCFCFTQARESIDSLLSSVIYVNQTGWVWSIRFISNEISLLRRRSLTSSRNLCGGGLGRTREKDKLRDEPSRCFFYSSRLTCDELNEWLGASFVIVAFLLTLRYSKCCVIISRPIASHVRYD